MNSQPQAMQVPEPIKEEVKEPVVHEPSTVVVVEQPKATPERLVEITGKPAMSQAELKKLAELKRMKAEAKKKKKLEKEVEASGLGAPVSKLPAMDSLPPLMMKRKGQFEMIPDFLKQKEVNKDMVEI